MLRIAEDSSVPVIVHLDHATDITLVKAAVELGVRSVMFDDSMMGHAENVKVAAEVVAWCHARGVAVEAELGEVGGEERRHTAGARTDPVEAAACVADTGVDPRGYLGAGRDAVATEVARLLTVFADPARVGQPPGH